MTSLSFITQPAYERVRHEAELTRPTNPNPGKPIAQHTHSASYDGLLKSPTTPDAIETSSLVSGKEEVKATESNETGHHLKRLHWSQEGAWPTALFALTTFSVLGLLVGSVITPQLIQSSPGYVLFPGRKFGAICDSSGNFYMTGSASTEVPHLRSPSGAFEITLGFGDMTFSNAKLIDVAWDVALGRGGQALLIYITYRVYSKVLINIMERSSVTLDVFHAITVQGGSSISAIYTLVRHFLTNATTKAKLSICWMIIAAVYTLLFQTLSSAMTGYSARSSPYIQLSDGTQQPATVLFDVVYIMHDAWRVGLTGDYIMTDPGDECWSIFCGIEGLDARSCNTSIDLNFASNYSGVSASCQVMMSTLWYLDLNVNSAFRDPHDSEKVISLQAPLLNITSYFSETWYSGLDMDNFLWTVPGSSYNYTLDNSTLQNIGICSPEKSYQWGFSGFLLVLTIILTTIWAMSMWAMWMYTYQMSKLDLYGRRMGPYRAAMDIAKVLQGEVAQSTDLDVLSEQELRYGSMVGKRTATISYKDLVAEKATTNRSMGLWVQHLDL